MKISIIIATYNAELFLQRALDSISIQKGCEFEVIVVDGGSRDGTIQIIVENQKLISNWISEKDDGIYDAWNKGVKMSTGDWIMFLGADDQLLPDALHSYKGFLESKDHTGILYVSSRMKIIDSRGNTIRIKGWPWEWPYFLKEMTVAHPGSLHSRQLFNDYGLFNSNYKSSGDFELLIRPKEKLSALFLDRITVCMQEGGISDSITGIKEHCKAAIHTGGYSPIFAYSNAVWVYIKHKAKLFLRRFGINAYLKK